MLKIVYQCKQLAGTFPMEIPSETDPTKTYVVTIDPHANRSELHTCTCNAYRYNRRCKHQKTAHLLICGWNELDGPPPLQEHINAGICPKCGGPMERAIYQIEE